MKTSFQFWIFLLLQIEVTMKLLALALFGFVIAESYAVSFFEVVVEEWEGWKTVHRKYLLLLKGSSQNYVGEIRCVVEVGKVQIFLESYKNLTHSPILTLYTIVI